MAAMPHEMFCQYELWIDKNALEAVGFADLEAKKQMLKDGPPSCPIMIRDLMTHTSGIVGSQRSERTLQEMVEAIAEWHAATGKLLEIGHTAWYRGNKLIGRRSRDTGYSIYDADRKTMALPVLGANCS